MKQIFRYIIIFGLLLGAYSCMEVSNDIPDMPYITTPYEMDLPPTAFPARFPPDNRPTVEGVQLGRMLFYDPILSADSSQSCASCHNQSFAFTDNGKQFSTGVEGLEGKRNAMPIFNLMWHLDGFFWDGRAELLRHQALLPIQDPLEMNETLGNMLTKLNASPRYQELFKQAFNVDNIDEKTVSLALEQFMMTIVSVNSKFDRVEMGLDSFTNQEKIGKIVFESEAIPLSEEIDPQNPLNYGGDCFHCHTTTLFMRREFLNNGLDETPLDQGLGKVTGRASDNGKFKTPSLRNIEVSAPYMHDGRFNTLEEVIDFYLTGAHANSPNLDPSMHALKEDVYLHPNHKAALIAFLKTLTDDTYLNNTEYSNPF